MDDDVDVTEAITNRVGHDRAAFGSGHIRRDEQMGVGELGGPSIPDRRSRADLQRRDLVAVQLEDELKLDGTAREISGKPVGDDGLAAFLSERKRLDRMLVFLLGLGLPSLDGGQPFDRFALVSHDGIFSKALGHSLGIAAVFGGDIDSDRCWKIDRHMAIAAPEEQACRANDALR